MSYAFAQIARRQLLSSIPVLSLTSRPFSTALPKPTNERKDYAIFMVADNDSAPIVGTERAPNFMHFKSTLSQVVLSVQSQSSKPSAPIYQLSEFDPPQVIPLHTGYNYGGRGAELSDLISTGAPEWKLYTFDDRTGIVFEVQAISTSDQARKMDSPISSWETWYGRHLSGMPRSDISLVPRWICADGAGTLPGGFKAEWSSLKDGKIIVGSHGYEVWPMPPFFPGLGMRNVQYVKEICPKTGSLRHLDWSAFYNSLSKAAGVVPNSGGYLTHEAVAWSSVHNRWFFMPRRFSKDQPWDPDKDTFRGCNMIISSEDPPAKGTSAQSVGPAKDIDVVQIKGSSDPSRGYSAMRFMPDTNDSHIVATKTVEPIDGPLKTYLTVLTIDGQVLLPETLISGDQKIEGLEIARL